MIGKGNHLEPLVLQGAEHWNFSWQSYQLPLLGNEEVVVAKEIGDIINDYV